MPELDFRIDGAEAVEFAAVPTLSFDLHVAERLGEPVRSIALNVQIRIAANQRFYGPEEQERLLEVFGEARRWRETLQSMLWTHSVLQVPAFSGATNVKLPVVGTYDFDVASAKYFHALQDGEIPLEFLFSGTVFYAGPVGLQAAQISWEKEAQFRLPVSLWKQAMERAFPGSAWIRLRRDIFDLLYLYKARQGLATWEAALERLLTASEEEVRT